VSKVETAQRRNEARPAVAEWASLRQADQAGSGTSMPARQDQKLRPTTVAGV